MSIEIRDWARSAEKRPITLYKSEENPIRPLVLIGGVHGDEPEGVALAEATLEWLKSYSANKNTHSSVKTLPWILIPCLNVDGYFRRERTNGHGVDLNRNYPTQDWSPVSRGPRYYPGPFAGSEPEIQAVVNLVHQYQPRLIIHCHSWHPCIVYKGEPALESAKALARSSGFKAMDDIGYPTPGSLSRYGWVENKIPIICIEADDKAPAYEAWPRFREGLKEIFTGHTLES